MTGPVPHDRRPSLRIGDVERGGAVEALGEHFAAGRLTHEEYDERADLALRARTAGDVAPLFHDLPAPWPSVLTGRPAQGAAVAARPRGPARPVSGPGGGGASRVPLFPLLLIVLGVAFVVEEVAVVLFAMAVFWWFCALRWRRARERWAGQWSSTTPGSASWSNPCRRR